MQAVLRLPEEEDTEDAIEVRIAELEQQKQEIQYQIDLLRDRFPLCSKEEELVSVQYVARQLSLSDDTVRRWARSGKIEAIPLPGGRSYRIRRQVLKELLSRRNGKVVESHVVESQ